jgi:hypothetical protein
MWLSMQSVDLMQAGLLTRRDPLVWQAYDDAE